MSEVMAAGKRKKVKDETIDAIYGDLKAAGLPLPDVVTKVKSWIGNLVTGLYVCVMRILNIPIPNLPDVDPVDPVVDPPVDPVASRTRDAVFRIQHGSDADSAKQRRKMAKKIASHLGNHCGWNPTQCSSAQSIIFARIAKLDNKGFARFRSESGHDWDDEDTDD